MVLGVAGVPVRLQSFSVVSAYLHIRNKENSNMFSRIFKIACVLLVAVMTGLAVFTAYASHRRNSENVQGITCVCDSNAAACPCKCGCEKSGKCDCGKKCPCTCGCGTNGKCDCGKKGTRAEKSALGPGIGKDKTCRVGCCN
jgi:hypothetical protein